MRPVGQRQTTGRLPLLNAELVRIALGFSAIRTQVVFLDAADVIFLDLT